MKRKTRPKSRLKARSRRPVVRLADHKRNGVANRLLQLLGGRSQRAWGRELGVAQANLSRYLSGTMTPHLDFLVHLAEAEKVNLNWLALGEGQMHRR